MSYWKCLFYLSAFTLAYGDIFDSGHSVLEVSAPHHHGHRHYMERDGDKVNIKLYYECLCPFCVYFHVNVLNKTVALLGSYLDLETYPYGNARTTKKDGKTVITCQHGPDECYGNKLHACAIDVLKNITLSVFYNSCMMLSQRGDDGSTDEDATDCGEQMGIDASPILKCAKGQRGEDLLEHYGEITQKIKKDGVPWVLINGELYDDDDDDNFIPTICKALAHPPPQCHED